MKNYILFSEKCLEIVSFLDGLSPTWLNSGILVYLLIYDDITNIYRKYPVGHRPKIDTVRYLTGYNGLLSEFTVTPDLNVNIITKNLTKI